MLRLYRLSERQVRPIQVHERITGISRELLCSIKELAENMGFEVLHGIVDCLWVIGEPISGFKETGSPSCLWLMALEPIIAILEDWMQAR
jgi:DNA polymerase elongation subunit (family B)